MGDVSFTGCSVDEEAFLREALRRSRALISTSAFEACLLRDMPAYAPCDDVAHGADPVWVVSATLEERVQGILKALRMKRPLHYECGVIGTGGVIGDVDSGAYGKALNEDLADFCAEVPDPVKWQTSRMARDVITQDFSFVIAAVAHEDLHNHDFHHGPRGGRCVNQAVGEKPVTQIVDDCVRFLDRSTTAICSPAYAQCETDGALVSRLFVGPGCSCSHNACDDCFDRDNDQLGDRCDACPNDPAPDVDGDGVCSNDNCPGTPNANQLDSDGDGLGDVCDPCPMDATPDVDGDGFCGADNCPYVSNADQLDLDQDGIGDPCDPDRDGDGVGQPPWGPDNCPDKSNATQSNVDSDFLGDACDCEVNSPLVGPGVYAAIPPNTCNIVQAQRWNDVILDDRLAAFALAVDDVGGLLAFDDVADVRTCRWGCLHAKPQESDFYNDMVQALLEDGILTEPPLPLGTDAFIARVAADGGPNASEVRSFLRRRLDREP